jgi:hypothetical protein
MVSAITRMHDFPPFLSAYRWKAPAAHLQLLQSLRIPFPSSKHEYCILCFKTVLFVPIRWHCRSIRVSVPSLRRILLKSCSDPGLDSIMDVEGGRDSVVAIAVGYWLDGPRIECRWRWDFPHPSWLAHGPTQPPIQWASSFFARGKWPRRGVDFPPPSSAEVKERVELYLYDPSGPSWSVLGRKKIECISVKNSARNTIQQVFGRTDAFFGFPSCSSLFILKNYE